MRRPKSPWHRRQLRRRGRRHSWRGATSRRVKQAAEFVEAAAEGGAHLGGDLVLLLQLTGGGDSAGGRCLHLGRDVVLRVQLARLGRGGTGGGGGAARDVVLLIKCCESNACMSECGAIAWMPINQSCDALFTADTVSTACRPAVRATSPTSSLRVAAYAAPAAAATACTQRENSVSAQRHKHQAPLFYAPRPGPAAAGLQLRPALPLRRGRRCRQPGAQPGCPSGPPARPPAPPAPPSPSAAPGPGVGRDTGRVREVRPGRGEAGTFSCPVSRPRRWGKGLQSTTHRAL